MFLMLLAFWRFDLSRAIPKPALIDVITDDNDSSMWLLQANGSPWRG